MEAHKPTRGTWALNQIARRAPELLTAFVDARAAAEAAQVGSDPAALRAALEAHRQRVGAILRAGEKVLAAAGRAAGPAERREISETLEAGGADTSYLRARLLSGRLEEKASLDPLAALVTGGAPAEPPAKEIVGKPTMASPKALRAEKKAEPGEKERTAAEARAQRERREREAAERERERALLAERERRARERAAAERAVAELEAAGHDAESERRNAGTRLEAAREALRRAEAEATSTARAAEDITARLADARRRLRTLQEER